MQILLICEIPQILIKIWTNMVRIVDKYDIILSVLLENMYGLHSFMDFAYICLVWTQKYPAKPKLNQLT